MTRHYEYRDGECIWVGPPYPVALGADVQKYRRLARIQKPDRDVSRAHGEAVETAIRKLQRTELMRSVTPTPSLKRPPIYRSPSPLNVEYSRPNPFRMVGDPDRTGDSSNGHELALRLYANRLGITRTEAEVRADRQQAILDGVAPAST